MLSEVEVLGGVGGFYSAHAIWRSEQNTTTSEQYLYLHRDYLGSILGITDKDGNFREKRHFDAWGNLVKLTDGNNVALTKFAVFDRGYTGHEHLQGVGLVHMNGRLYDPVIHRFLMPDNFVQDPYNTQVYNRYGYALNNPLMYTDPSGEILPLLIWGGAALIGAYIGGAQANGSWNPLKWDYKSSNTWIGIVGGAAIGAASAGIGIAVSAAVAPVLVGFGITGGILGGGITGLLSGIAAGGFSGGFTSLLPGGGGDFWGGLVKGAWTGGLLGATIGGLMTPKGSNIWTGVAPRPAVAPVSTVQPAGISMADDAASIKAEVFTSKIASPSPSTNPSVAPSPNTGIKDGMGVIELNIKATKNPFDLVKVSTSTQGVKPVGSYLLEFQGTSNSNMFYAGKGTESRMLQSINRIENTFGDKLLKSTFTPANSAKDAFIQEHILMMQFGGPKSFNTFSPTYNLIFSPGKKLGGF